MSNDTSRSRQTRSASLCAPGFSSMEEMLASVPTDKEPEPKRERGRNSASGTPDSGNTPTRRRRPATRSQSARASGGGKSIRRRAAAQAASQQQHGGGGMKSPHCSSEPKLSENNVSPGIRRRGSRRGQSMHHVHHRKSNAFLDVPDANPQQLQREEGEDEDSYRLRSFSLTSKGIVNRGDSFRRRRSRSDSLAPDADNEPKPLTSPKKVLSYNVGMLGARGVGKTALISQFMTSECINAYDRQRDETPSEQSVSVMLNGEESELKFLNITNLKTELDELPEPDAFVIMYSVIDKASFQRVEEYLTKLHDRDLLRSRPVILVGNKIDLVRSRTVSIQDGKCMACTYRAKFIEISVGINHNVDDLLVGILSQIRLKCRYLASKGANSTESSSAHWYKSRGVLRASMKARQMLTWLFGKEDTKFKNCENLHVL